MKESADAASILNLAVALVNHIKALILVGALPSLSRGGSLDELNLIRLEELVLQQMLEHGLISFTHHNILISKDRRIVFRNGEPVGEFRNCV